MSWWDRYQAWRPEDRWDRYQAWRLASRPRYVATGVGLRVLIVSLLSLFSGSLERRTVLVMAIFVVVATLLWWFLYYPRAKARSQHSSLPPSTTHV